jgi:DNA primase
MGIADEDIERVRAATDLAAVVGEHVALRRSGTRWVGLCPFHTERTPSFSVNGELGFFYCFGCGAKGDAITFVREVHQLDFVAAVELLAGRAGVEIRWDNRREAGERRRRSRLVEALGRAVEWYHERLLTAPDAATARGYLRSRGYDGETVRRFRLGWAPDDWDALCRALSLPTDVAGDAGLGFVNQRGKLQDHFRGRVLFPIFDARGDPVGFGGRILPGGRGPKYKNSPATAVYDKSEVLYGLNWAKGEVVEHGEVVVCEGYTDVIGLTAVGVGRAVATCGTALTERHVATLRRFASRIVLAFDADSAGQGAAERVYGWERRHQVDVAVAALPGGTDPGDLARTDPEALRRAVARAAPFLSFRLERLLSGAPLASVEARARVAEEARELIAEHPDQIVREDYATKVAVRLDVRPEHLLRGQGGSRRGRPEPRPARPQRAESPSLLALNLAVHQPHAVADGLHQALFADPVEVAAYRALEASDTFRDAVAGADPEAAELLHQLGADEVTDVPAGEVVARLVGDAVSRVLRQLEADARTSDGPPVDPKLVGWLKLRQEDLLEEGRRSEAVGQLLPFLVARAEEGT